MCRPARNSPVILAAASGGTPASYSAWLAAVEAAGATPTAAKQAAMLEFFAGLEADGLWAEWTATTSFLYILVGTNPADTATNRYNEASLNLILPGGSMNSATVVNQHDAGLADEGITGGNSMHWGTGLNPQTHIGAARFGNFSMGTVVTEPLVDAQDVSMGIQSGWYLHVRWLDSNSYLRMNNQELVVAASGAAGLFTGTTKNGFVKQYRNTTEVASAVLGAQHTANFEILCYNRTDLAGNPDAGLYSVRRYGAFFGLPGMTGSQVTAFYARLQTLMAAFGATI